MRKAIYYLTFPIRYLYYLIWRWLYLPIRYHNFYCKDTKRYYKWNSRKMEFQRKE